MNQAMATSITRESILQQLNILPFILLPTAKLFFWYIKYIQFPTSQAMTIINLVKKKAPEKQ